MKRLQGQGGKRHTRWRELIACVWPLSKRKGKEARSAQIGSVCGTGGCAPPPACRVRAPLVPAWFLASILACIAGMIITSALMIWKSLILFTGSESPVSGPEYDA